MRSTDRPSPRQRELITLIDRIIREDGTVDLPGGIELRRASSPGELGHGVSYPAFCIIAQGSKEMLLGDHSYHYDPAHYLIATAALPIFVRITEASKEQPYLGFLIRLDPVLVGSVLAEIGALAPQSNASLRAIDVSPLDEDLLDAILRLVKLLDSDVETKFLMPLVQREIVYRLALGEQGGRLNHLAATSGNSHIMIRALSRLREEFDQPLSIEELASDLGMSVSSFHSHFKAVTGMSPLQFQKQLRLQEARRLMLGDEFDATTAAYRVGYGDASQFNREYKRLFGEPPMRDINRLRQTDHVSARM